MSEGEKVKVGVVGVGALGRHHARLYKEIQDAGLVGVYDASPERAAEIAKEFSVPAFESAEALAEKCDALSVAVPATLHHKAAAPLLKMRRHVMMEKPLAAALDEAKEIVSLARSNNLVLGVGHVERFNPAMDYLEKFAANTRFIEAHRLAEYPPPRPGAHRRGTEVGVVLDLMIHDIDLALSMVNSEVERFDAVGVPVLSETEDIASVRIKFVNGGVANLTASRVSGESVRKFRVFQTDCYISMDYGKRTGLIVKKSQLGMARKSISLDEKNALKAELENFVSCVRTAKETGKITDPKVSGEQGLRALELALKITEEIKSYNERYGFKLP
jgi:predicted dehydrogenase